MRTADGSGTQWKFKILRPAAPLVQKISISKFAFVFFYIGLIICVNMGTDINTNILKFG